MYRKCTDWAFKELNTTILHALTKVDFLYEQAGYIHSVHNNINNTLGNKSS